MSRLWLFLVISLAGGVLAACEPQNVAVAPSSAVTAAPTQAASAGASSAAGPGASAGASAAASAGPHAPGVATVATTAAGVQVGGHGPVLKSPKFDLAGNVVMKLSTCGSNGTFPFIWLYTEFNSSVGQYVEEVTHIKTAKGTYYVHVVSPPDCEWTVDFAAE